MRVANCDLETDAMGRSSRKWPNIYKRVLETGRERWVVDLGKQGDNLRVRRYFDTRADAEGFAQQARVARANQGAVAFSLPFDVQTDAIKLHEFLKPHGISFRDVQEHYATKVIPYLAIPKVAVVCVSLAETVADCRPSWRKTLQGFLKEFAGVFGDRRLMDITEDELRHFCFGHGRAPRTCKNRRAMASQLFNYAISKWVKKDPNPAKNLATPRQEDKQPEILKLDEVARLLATADKFGLLGYALLNLFGAMRPDEVKRFDWRFVHLDAGQIEVPASVSKIHAPREIPINPTLAAWLPLCYQEAGPIVDTANFAQRFRDWRKAARVDHWSNDVLRHTFASIHLPSLQDANETARQMGHIETLRTLYKHYVAFMSKADAERYWALRPSAMSVPTREAA